jgi:hypothetical protein
LVFSHQGDDNMNHPAEVDRHFAPVN